MRLNIKDKLEEKGMSRYALAQKVDISYPTITAIYNGNSTSIKLETLEAICRELECTPNDIIVPDDPTLKRLFSYYELLKKKDDSN